MGRFVLSNLEQSGAISLDDINSSDDATAAAGTFRPQPYADLEAGWEDLDLASRWVLSAHNALIGEVSRLCNGHQYGEAGRQLYDFLWRDLADWYVEAAKVSLFGADPARAASTRQVLYHVLERSLTLLHPFMPFVTEAIWQHLPKSDASSPALIVSRWPAAGRVDSMADADFALLQEIIRGVRNARAEYEVEPGRRIAATVRAGGRAALLSSQKMLLCQLTKLDADRVTISPDAVPPADAHATLVVGEGIEVWLPLAGMVDLVRERARLAESLSATADEVDRLRGVLANESFTGRAPQAVVQRERDRLAEAEGRLTALEERVRAAG